MQSAAVEQGDDTAYALRAIVPVQLGSGLEGWFAQGFIEPA